MEEVFEKTREIIVKNLGKVTLGVSESGDTIIDFGNRSKYKDDGAKIKIENIDKKKPGVIKIWAPKNVIVILKNCIEVVIR